MAMMDRAYIVAHQVVERYLAGRLSETEVEQFEVFLLAHPELEDELRLTEQFKLGLRTLRERGELQALAQPGVPVWRQPAWAVAALVLVAVGVALFFGARDRDSSGPLIAASLADLRLPGEMAARSAVSLNLRTARSPAPAVSLLPREPTAIALQILPDLISQGGTYGVRMTSSAEPRSEHALAGLKLADDSNLHVYFRSDRIGRGEYEIQVMVRQADGTEGPAGTFRILFQ